MARIRVIKYTSRVNKNSPKQMYFHEDNFNKDLDGYLHHPGTRSKEVVVPINKYQMKKVMNVVGSKKNPKVVYFHGNNRKRSNL